MFIPIPTLLRFGLDLDSLALLFCYGHPQISRNSFTFAASKLFSSTFAFQKDAMRSTSTKGIKL